MKRIKRTGASFIWWEAEGIGTVQPGEERAWEGKGVNLINVCKYLMGESKEDWAMPSKEMRCKKHKLKFHLEEKRKRNWTRTTTTTKKKNHPALEIFCCEDVQTGTNCPEGLWSLHFETFQTKLDMFLGNLLQLTLLKKEDSTKWSGNASSTPTTLRLMCGFSYQNSLVRKKIPNRIYFHALQWKWDITDDSPTKHMLLSVHFSSSEMQLKYR